MAEEKKLGKLDWGNDEKFIPYYSTKIMTNTEICEIVGKFFRENVTDDYYGARMQPNYGEVIETFFVLNKKQSDGKIAFVEMVTGSPKSDIVTDFNNVMASRDFLRLTDNAKTCLSDVVIRSYDPGNGIVNCWDRSKNAPIWNKVVEQQTSMVDAASFYGLAPRYQTCLMVRMNINDVLNKLYENVDENGDHYRYSIEYKEPLDVVRNNMTGLEFASKFRVDLTRTNMDEQRRTHPEMVSSNVNGIVVPKL